ncbi:MAG: M16 family metallopeptidase [Caldilineaceae bacterium]
MSSAPAQSRSNSLPGSQNTTRRVLDNGLAMLARPNRAAPVVVLEGMLAVPATLDLDGRTGLSSFTANLLTRGSERFSYDEVNEAIESVGASLSISADSEGLTFGITCLSEDFGALVQVLADALRRPRFDADQFALVRRQKLVRLQERDQEPSAVAALRFYERLYGGHPLGQAVSGYTETVSRIQRDDLVEFHRTWYGPAGGAIALSGDIEPDRALGLLSDAFGDWAPAIALPVSPPPPATVPSRLHVPMADKVQSEIVLGVCAVPRLHPDFSAMRVANTVLGVFGMMGRLGEVVREQQGLAYYAYSSQDTGRDSGVWLASAGVAPEDVEQALDAMTSEFARLGAEPVPAEELADSQDYLTGVLPLTLETNDGIASTLLNIEWYGLGLDYLATYADTIRSITADDVQRVAATYLQAERLVAVTAGPEAEE